MEQKHSRFNMIANLIAVGVMAAVALPLLLAGVFYASGWMFTALHYMVACVRGGA